jgi:hypothetical protein
MQNLHYFRRKLVDLLYLVIVFLANFRSSFRYRQQKLKITVVIFVIVIVNEENTGTDSIAPGLVLLHWFCLGDIMSAA